MNIFFREEIGEDFFCGIFELCKYLIQCQEEDVDFKFLL